MCPFPFPQVSFPLRLWKALWGAPFFWLCSSPAEGETMAPFCSPAAARAEKLAPSGREKKPPQSFSIWSHLVTEGMCQACKVRSKCHPLDHVHIKIAHQLLLLLCPSLTSRYRLEDPQMVEPSECLLGKLKAQDFANYICIYIYIYLIKNIRNKIQTRSGWRVAAEQRKICAAVKKPSPHKAPFLSAGSLPHWR